MNWIQMQNFKITDAYIYLLIFISKNINNCIHLLIN
jgi:hypothetical protein